MVFGGSTDVYAFALFPAVMWGLSPILSKFGFEREGTSLQASVVVVAVGTLLYWVGLLALRGPASLAAVTPRPLLIFLASGAIGGVVWFASFAGIDRVGASVSSAGFSVHPLFAAVLALAWLGERLTLATDVGIVVLMVGLVVLALSDGGDIRGWEVRDLVYPLGAAALYGISNVIRRYGLTTTNVSTLPAITINTTATLVVLLVYVVVRRPRAVRSLGRPSLYYFVGSGVLSALALFSMFEAFDRGSVAVVSALSGTSPLFVTVFAFLLLRDVERVTLRVVAGAVLIVVGAALITAV